MRIQLSDHFNYRKLLRFCISPMAMMIFVSIYGVVDGLFVSNFVGKSSFAAINLIMPVTYILGGLGFMAGTGGSALVGKTLGEGKNEKASDYFTMMVKFILVVGSAASLVVAVIMKPVAVALGADQSTLRDCVVYGTIIALFNPACMLQNMFQNFLTTAEKPKLGLTATVLSGVTNMALDALFVAVFRWGVAGAALATGISQCVGSIFPLIYFARPNDSLLHLTRAKMEWEPVGKACWNGFSELLSNVSGSIVSMAYNFQLLKYAGNDGVAAYGVLMYLDFVFIAVFIGYSIGTAPIVSFHYGAGNRDELKNILKKSTVLTLISGLCMMFFSEMIAVPLSEIFVGYDSRLLDMTVHAFHLFVLSFVFVGFNIFASSFFTALNDGGISALISFLRTVVFQLIPIQFLPLIWGLDGIWSALTVSEGLAFLLSAGFILAKRRKYGY